MGPLQRPCPPHRETAQRPAPSGLRQPADSISEQRNRPAGQQRVKRNKTVMRIFFEIHSYLHSTPLACRPARMHRPASMVTALGSVAGLHHCNGGASAAHLKYLFTLGRRGRIRRMPMHIGIDVSQILLGQGNPIRLCNRNPQSPSSRRFASTGPGFWASGLIGGLGEATSPRSMQAL